ncbi:hypothetical protein, partial [Nocardioides sp.]|uniref:hypothetical protein n=1 Tax=Nocardioides sp. TaxID=35761 RepID=UPI00273412CE
MSPTPPAPHLVLRPGVRVIRRDDRTLQIGLEAGVRHLVADTEVTEAWLDALQRGEQPPPLTRATRLLCHELLERGLLVDAHLLDTLPREPTAAGAVAAVVAETGRRAPAVLRARAAARVVVTGPASAAARLTALLAPEGVAVHTAVPDASEAADVVVVLAQGEADREVLDRMARRDVPH